MSDSNIPETQKMLADIDTQLRERLKALGVESEHVLLAMLSNGAGVIRSNVGTEVLGNMAEMLMDIADEAIRGRPRNEPLN